MLHVIAFGLVEILSFNPLSDSSPKRGRVLAKVLVQEQYSLDLCFGKPYPIFTIFYLTKVVIHLHLRYHYLSYVTLT